MINRHIPLHYTHTHTHTHTYIYVWMNIQARILSNQEREG